MFYHEGEVYEDISLDEFYSPPVTQPSVIKPLTDLDPESLLEWLNSTSEDDRDMQVTSLELLCIQLLMSDNSDKCFGRCEPSTFIPVLCRFFLDETTPVEVLEAAARAITCYVNKSSECSTRVVQIEGAVKAICYRLAVGKITSTISVELAEQCVKILNIISSEEVEAVYEANGLSHILCFVRENGQHVNRDCLNSAAALLFKLCTKIQPEDNQLSACVSKLRASLCNNTNNVNEALKCFASISDRFNRIGLNREI